MRALASLLCLTVLAGCAAGPPVDRDRIKRMLAGAPGKAQPSKVVAAELAFARMAREDGQWTAFKKFAAPGAVIHGRDGPVNARDFVSSLKDPAEAVQWEPDAVWMSCDATLAVSRGRFRDPGGIVGNYVTVWELQRDSSYLYSYDIGSPDNPQPPPPAPLPEPGPGDIVVDGYESVKGEVADCPGRGETVPPPAPASYPATSQFGAGVSSDGTLHWRWEHGKSGERKVTVLFFAEGKWHTKLAQDLPLPKN